MKTARISLVSSIMLLLAGCVVPQNYHPGATSVQTLRYAHNPEPGGYFANETFDEAYIEFDAQGKAFEPAQTAAAVAKIQQLNANNTKQMLLMIFVHGWKNNASENSGNVWGFRRMLNHEAQEVHKANRKAGVPDVPIMGLYIGWPGQVLPFAQDLTIFDRMGVGYAVGGGDLGRSFKAVLQAAKGSDYQGPSDVVLIGHSFGGLAGEKAMLPLLQASVDDAIRGNPVRPPADFIVWLNEAAPSWQGRDLLETLKKNHLTYSTGEGAQEVEFPLVAAMTSDGDVATKLLLPGSQAISANRPKTVPLSDDDFGQKDSLPYQLQSSANFAALRSHEFKKMADVTNCDKGISVRNIHNVDYCINPIAGAANDTPFWIMGLPQIFVPDHSTVFRDEWIALIDAFLTHRGLISAPTRPPAKAEHLGRMREVTPDGKPARPNLRRRAH